MQPVDRGYGGLHDEDDLDGGLAGAPAAAGYCCRACGDTRGQRHGGECEGRRADAARPAADPLAAAPVGGAWQECGGYRLRAPLADAQANNRRIREGDERAVQQLRERKRAQALDIMRSSPNAVVLGSAGDGPQGMHDARQALLKKLEREADPRLRKAQRKESDQRARQEKQEKEQKEQQQRQQNWQANQERQQATDRRLNEEKRKRWEAWDQDRAGDSADEAGSSSTLGQPQLTAGPANAPPVPPSRGDSASGASSPAVFEGIGCNLVGRWRRGRPANDYHIVQRVGGRLWFDGPDPKGGRLAGALAWSGDAFLEARLLTGSGAVFGTMRFFVEQDAGGHATLTSCFKKHGSAEWGEPKPAEKVVEHSAAAMDVDEGDVRPPMATGYSDQLVDPNLWQCRRCTLVNNEDVASCSACDEPRSASSFAHGGARAQSSQEAINLAVGTALGSVLPPQVQVAQVLVAQLAAAAPQMPSGQSSQVAGLLAWLQGQRLEQYHEVLVEQGFEELDDLTTAEDKDLDNIFSLLEVKPGHLLRFRRAVQAARAKQPPAAAGSPAAAGREGVRECAVCLDDAEEGVDTVLVPCGHVFCREHAQAALRRRECHVCRGCTTAVQKMFA